MAADRFVLKQFAGSATNNGAFGAAQATGVGVQPVADIKDVQSLNAFEQGWNAATLTSDKLPALEEMQGLEALLCKALKENYSEGVPFWIAGETYFQYSFVNYNGVLYYNTTGGYTNNNPATDTANWAAYNKVGTATVGTDDTPIYLNVGNPTAGKRMGVVAYDNTKTYNLDDVVLNVDSSGAVVLYLSLAASNTSALTDTTKWKKVSLGGGGEIGDMGFAPLGIDESLNLRRYLNGQVISQDLSPSFTNKVKEAITLHPSLGTTEASWQSELAASKLGQCGKFVVDDVNNTIRLPAVVNAQGLLSLSGIGNLVNESLPNITGFAEGSTNQVGQFQQNERNGCVETYNKGPGYVTSQFTTSVVAADSFRVNASWSSSTYQDNAPVQQEAIQYPYYIQVATGVEETLPAIREYKVNNSDFFGKSMYSENAPYNASWLASNGQYNASTLYPDFWTQLTGVELNSSLNVGDTIEIGGKTYVKRGLPVVLSTGTYTDYDFVVDSANSQFRLPLLNGERVLVAKKEATAEDPTWYNWYSDGWCEQGCHTGNLTANQVVYLSKPYLSANYSLVISEYNNGIGTNFQSYDRYITSQNLDSFSTNRWTNQTGAINWYACGYSSIPTQSDFTEVSGLYYYVGDTVQDASLINAGAVLNTLSGKIGYDDLTTVHCVVETYQSGASWYRVYDDGWVEQGGLAIATPSTSAQQISLLKSYISNYSVFITRTSTADNYLQVTITAQTAASFTTGYSCNKYWFACGYGA